MKNAILFFVLICSAWTLSAQSSTFTDSRDNEVYKTVKIGNQTWMAENLRYNISGSVLNVKNPNKDYGRYYNWEQAKKACPNGWHLPTAAEWETLKTKVGKDEAMQLKSVEYWELKGKGNNSSGMNIVPAGWRRGSGDYFEKFGTGAFFWTATDDSEDLGFDYIAAAKLVSFSDVKNNLSFESWDHVQFLSCRCVKD